MSRFICKMSHVYTRETHKKYLKQIEDGSRKAPQNIVNDVCHYFLTRRIRPSEVDADTVRRALKHMDQAGYLMYAKSIAKDLKQN